MKNVVIFGAPGAGKGTQSDKIIAKYGFKHFSTGDILRKQIAEGTELGKTAKKFMDEGKLVTDDLIINMIDNELEAVKDASGVIFDGFPRTYAQAEALKVLLNKRGTDVSVMLNIHVDDEELIARLINRGKTSGRSDDNLETIQKRLVTYKEQTTPVIDFYKKEGTCVDINGVGELDTIFADICKAIDSSK
ncbi:MAG: adenylate kinase [Paludibacteraceae bacterium]|nr:adenylate kinase [Paludibacteraceae bacterium]MBR6105472.1 adenylate kinase [Paludibacteraceae bacterium]